MKIDNILHIFKTKPKRFLFLLPEHPNDTNFYMKSLPMSIVNQYKPYGIIRFIHGDGNEHSFWTAVNDLTGSRLSAFDGNAPDIDQSMAYVKSVFADIRQKATVISYDGTKHFK